MSTRLPTRFASARLAEDKVVAWLLQRQYRIVFRNFRRPGTELDIVAERAGRTYVLEVKYRKQPVQDPRELVSPKKIRALWKGMAYLKALDDNNTERTMICVLVLLSREDGLQFFALPQPGESF